MNAISVYATIFHFSLFLYVPRLLKWCRYKDVAEEVLAETKLTATDKFKQNAVAFFDNKFNSLVPLKAAYFVQ